MKSRLFRSAALLLAALCGVLQVLASQGPTVDRVEPPFWWAGMRQPSLQLMVYGPEIGNASVTCSYAGVTVDSVVRADSPNYLFVYLNIGADARPGTVDLKFAAPDGAVSTVPYVLKERTMSPDRYKGFDASDVLYLIMPDRFAKASDSAEKGNAALRFPAKIDRDRPNARHGGDIAGIRRHLGYIDTLGVTAIWLNPVLENDIPGGSYHGYATTNYYAIDPRFGTNDDWNALVAEAHDRGIKVVMDMIFNHSGVKHPWIDDKPFTDWLNFPDRYVQTNHRLSTVYDPYASDYDRRRTVDGWFVPGMPDLNQRNPHLLKYLVQNSIWWIEESKIDGIRMDTHPYADMQAMGDWIKAVETEYPQFNIVGECWYGNEGSSAFWQKGSRINAVTNPELPTVMDFVLCLNARQAFGDDTRDREGLNKIYDHLALDFMFEDPSRILTFLDNHDTDRFLTELPDNLDKWKQAQAFLLTSRGIPQIYYGTEILMNGTRANGGDGMIRLDMPGGFPGDTVSVFTAAGRTPLQNEAYQFLSTLLNYRRGNDVIARGSLKHFVPEQGVYTYERRLGDRSIVVMMNGRDQSVDLDMEPTAEVLPVGTTWRDVLTGNNVTITDTMQLAPRALYILEPQP